MNNPKNELDAVEEVINETKARLRKAEARLDEAEAHLDEAIEDGDIKRRDRLEEHISNIQGHILELQKKENRLAELLEEEKALSGSK